MHAGQQAEQHDDDEESDMDVARNVSLDALHVVDHRDEHHADDHRFVAQTPVLVALEREMQTAQVAAENAEADAAEI